ncbi:AAA family ATPase [Vibrio sp.]|uniref:nucleotide-binding protein n=1 Tax=Vibrio sp. TaxID=678 RepID=UPI003D1419BC
MNIALSTKYFSSQFKQATHNKKIGIAHSKAKKVIVLNAKGGVGKSTVTAGLVSKLIQDGYQTELVDFDRQKSTYNWANLVGSLPCQAFNPAMRSFTDISMSLKVDPQSEFIVIDSPSNMSEAELARYIRFVDHIIIPIQPSPVDLKASLPFIEMLISRHLYRDVMQKVKLGFVINRTQNANDEKLRKVMHLLSMFSQHSTLGMMSESDHYQEAFLNDSFVEKGEVDDTLWKNILLWLNGNKSLTN